MVTLVRIPSSVKLQEGGAGEVLGLGIPIIMVGTLDLEVLG